MTSETATEEEKDTAQDIVEEVLPEGDTEQEASTEEAQEEKKEEHVPISAHVAERKKRQEAEQRALIYEQQLRSMQQPQQQQADNSDDLLTVGQLNSNMAELKRQVAEETWLDDNPDKVEKIKDELPDLLKDPKNKWLADSIPQAQNRLKRAWQIYEMIKKQSQPARVAQSAPDRTNTPKSPQSVSKTNKLSLTDRIMEMSDQELEEWRLSQKRKVR